MKNLQNQIEVKIEAQCYWYVFSKASDKVIMQVYDKIVRYEIRSLVNQQVREQIKDKIKAKIMNDYDEYAPLRGDSNRIIKRKILKPHGEINKVLNDRFHSNLSNMITSQISEKVREETWSPIWGHIFSQIWFTMRKNMI